MRVKLPAKNTQDDRWGTVTDQNDTYLFVTWDDGHYSAVYPDDVEVFNED